MTIPTGSTVEIVQPDDIFDADLFLIGRRGVAYQIRDAWPIQVQSYYDQVLVFFVDDHGRRATKLRTMEIDDAVQAHVHAYKMGEQACIPEACLKVVGNASGRHTRRGKRHRYKEQSLER